jgi:hypothetical protein
MRNEETAMNRKPCTSPGRGSSGRLLSALRGEETLVGELNLLLRLVYPGLDLGEDLPRELLQQFQVVMSEHADASAKKSHAER